MDRVMNKYLCLYPCVGSIVLCIGLRANWINSFSRSWVRKGATIDPGFGGAGILPAILEQAGRAEEGIKSPATNS